MKKCTETDNINTEHFLSEKPLVSIVLATYNPRLDWLIEQLDSLERQTYRPLELLILDDCSGAVDFNEIQHCVKDCIQSIPYQIMQNKVNLGSTKTFEKLTMLVNGEYIAYCDQDDVWNRDKIETLLGYFSKESVKIAYSDVVIIDTHSNKKADSITDYRRRHVLYSGFGLAEKLIIQNFVIGCAMLVRRNIAQQAVPFVPNMVHDHYLALMASVDGEVALCNAPLVCYRIHNSNQTNTLSEVNNKSDYYNIKIKNFCVRLELLKLKKVNKKIPEFYHIKIWADAREAYYKKGVRNAILIWKFRDFDLEVSLFELIAMKLPDRVFSFFLKIIKKEES